MSDTINIRLELEGDMAEKFKAIKEKMGIENNTEVVRVLINSEFKEIQKEAQKR